MPFRDFSDQETELIQDVLCVDCPGSPDSIDAWAWLECLPSDGLTTVTRAYKRKLTLSHPDKEGGSNEALSATSVFCKCASLIGHLI